MLGGGWKGEEETGKRVSGRGSVALMMGWEGGVGAGRGSLDEGLGERAHFAQSFESIVLTIEHLFGSLFLCSRRKTSVPQPPTMCFASA